MNVLVAIQHISKSFDKHSPPALQDIKASIHTGELVGLVGPDGAGKTTLIRLIASLLKPTSGHITIKGYDTVQQAEIIPFLISYMPQKFGLYEDLTVIQNLNLYADLKGVIGKERKERLEKLLKFTNLNPFKNRFAKDLSGGMKQKLGLACSLVKTPDLLLLDEPSVGVDPISRRELWAMVQELLKDKITVVWSTSYLDEAERCQSVLLLNEGKLLFHGDPKELTKRVQGRTYKIETESNERRPLLAQVLKDKNVMDAVIQGDHIHLLVKEQKEPLLESLLRVSLKPDHAYFEDAFVDILGGNKEKTSILAQSIPEVRQNKQVVIEASHLTKKFGDFTAANDITFTVKTGEIFGLLGPNGAGKSTTFKMMCGLLKPTSGQALVNGLDLQQAPSEARSHIGYMAQKFSLYGNLSVKQNLDFFSGIYNLKGQNQKKIIQEMVQIFNLKPFLNDSAEQLPLGFKQRLALSCSVMHYPTILFLDEPTSGVDPITRREFWMHINGLVEKGITIIVTTHFMDEAEYCDRIALVYKSKIIKMGTPTELKKEARTKQQASPSLEDAFVQLIQQYEEQHHA